MYRNVLAMCAEAAIVDRETNNLSLITIIEVISPTAYPVILPQATWVFVWERDMDDPAEGNALFTLRVNGEQVLAQPVPVRFEEKHRARVIIRINGIQITGDGALEAEARLGDSTARVQTPVGRVDQARIAATAG